jgi:hypothetical protein
MIAALAVLAAPAGPAEGRLLLTRDDAIRHVFGDSARSETVTLYLTPEEVAAVRQRARAPFDQARVTYYRVSLHDTLAGIAFVDRHIVRSSSETVLIAVAPDTSVRAVEILAWNEPEDYLPPERWLEWAAGLREPPAVRPGDAVPRIAGATLTGQAVTAAIRRALALAERILPAAVRPKR